jgi:hypothetical protein
MDGTKRVHWNVPTTKWITYSLLDKKLPSSPPGYDELGKGELNNINPKDR